MPEVDSEQFNQLILNSDIKNACQMDFDDSGLLKKFKYYIVDNIQMKLFYLNVTEQFNLDNEALEIMIEDPKVRIFGTESKYEEVYLPLKKYVTVSYYYPYS